MGQCDEYFYAETRSLFSQLNKFTITLVIGYLQKPEWEIGERNEGNDGNAGNQGGNTGNQGGNAGNQGGNEGNHVGNAWNQGGNLRIGVELMNYNFGEE